MKGAAILFTEMTPDYDWEDRFNRWYDTHRIPVRMEVSGFLGAQRYKDSDRPNYLAVYELEALAVLDSEAYQTVSAHPNAESKWMLDNVAGFTRYVGEAISDQRRDDPPIDPLDAPILYSTFFSVPDEAAEAFNAWYTEDHVPTLLECPDWLACRRFLITEGDPQPWTHLALHYIMDMSAFDSPQREKARSSQRRTALAEEPWFNASTHIYEIWGERFVPSAFR